MSIFFKNISNVCRNNHYRFILLFGGLYIFYQLFEINVHLRARCVYCGVHHSRENLRELPIKIEYKKK